MKIKKFVKQKHKKSRKRIILSEKTTGFISWISILDGNTRVFKPGFSIFPLLKTRGVLLIVVLLVLFFLLKSFFFSARSEKYSFDTVENGTVTQQVSVNGNVSAANATDVFSPTNGVLQKVFVKNGDSVSRGDVIFTVRSTATPQEQAASFASYQTALNVLNTAKNAKLALDASMWTKHQAYLNAQNEQNYKNNNIVYPVTGKNYTNLEKQSIDASVTQAQKDFAAAEQAFKTADVAIADGQAQVSATYLAYQATQTMTMTAPIEGKIHNLIGLAGARVEAQNSAALAFSSANSLLTQTQSTAATPVLVIGNDESEFTIQSAVSEVYANKVELGQRVTILFNGIANKIYKGRVVQLDTFGTNTQGVITYNVFVAIDETDQDIRPNMSAILTINVAEREDVLTGANAAVITYEGKKAVQVLKADGEIEFIPVKVGLRGNTRTEIISGVDEGDEIIVGNTEFINQESGSFSLGE